jgi:Icc-related predicted phosphoesterase
VHAGFVALANYINKYHPLFLLHGHQHLKQETLVGTTRVIGTYGFQWLVIPE